MDIEAVEICLEHMKNLPAISALYRKNQSFKYLIDTYVPVMASEIKRLEARVAKLEAGLQRIAFFAEPMPGMGEQPYRVYWEMAQEALEGD